MIAIRIPKKERGKARRAMIEIGPITLVAKDATSGDPVYVVSPTHVGMLLNRGFNIEIIEAEHRSSRARALRWRSS